MTESDCLGMPSDDSAAQLDVWMDGCMTPEFDSALNEHPFSGESIWIDLCCSALDLGSFQESLAGHLMELPPGNTLVFVQASCGWPYHPG